jgi:hypothetical protein
VGVVTFPKKRRTEYSPACNRVGDRQYIAATSGSPSNLRTDKDTGPPTVIVFRLP